MAHYKLAIFDLAGTTIKDTNTVGKCLQEALATVGVDASVAEVSALMGIPKPIAIAQLLEDHQVAADVESVHQEFRRLMIATYTESAEVGEIPGTSETFRSLKELGIRVAVDTGFDRETTEVLMRRVEWGDLVDDSITSDEVAKGRPHPDMILTLCDRAGVTPAETIKIGDTPSDVQEGKAAKVALTIGVTYGTHTAEELRGYSPDVLLDKITDLLLLDL